MEENKRKRGRPLATTPRKFDVRSRVNEIEYDILRELKTNSKSSMSNIVRKSIVEYYANHPELHDAVNHTDNCDGYDYDDYVDDEDDYDDDYDEYLY